MNIDLLAEFTANVAANLGQLQRLFKAYDLAALCYDDQRQQCDDIDNKVLRENAFYAAEGDQRAGIRPGDRITDQRYSFLLSDDDFNALQRLSLPILAAEGVTDEDGEYLTDWLGLKIDAECGLASFIIDNIVPSSLRPAFKGAKGNFTLTAKLLAIIRPMIAESA